MKPTYLFALAFVCFSVLTAPAVADQAAAESEPSSISAAGPATCREAPHTPSDPLLVAGCFVEVECADGSTVSCNGNSTCSTGGTNHRCVICDGVNEGCCPKTCCEECEENLELCLNECINCNICYTAYNYCVSQCSGGCP